MGYLFGVPCVPIKLCTRATQSLPLRCAGVGPRATAAQLAADAADIILEIELDKEILERSDISDFFRRGVQKTLAKKLQRLRDLEPSFVAERGRQQEQLQEDRLIAQKVVSTNLGATSTAPIQNALAFSFFGAASVNQLAQTQENVVTAATAAAVDAAATAAVAAAPLGAANQVVQAFAPLNVPVGRAVRRVRRRSKPKSKSGRNRKGQFLKGKRPKSKAKPKRKRKPQKARRQAAFGDFFGLF